MGTSLQSLWEAGTKGPCVLPWYSSSPRGKSFPAPALGSLFSHLLENVWFGIKAQLKSKVRCWMGGDHGGPSRYTCPMDA